ncbi:Oidioi.mRNA.OKI2018_I69.XSR.g15155.t1.cds [Oikopleura dioica]|uniref:Oidioi.mRNA.OKI2018_I69.XSR.g15155.t1.cds n=1 Tax=Oikopleura dioica TaxID=34765 RepID=A0ABN7SH53_OIKDI|nr:Oidioi.mRNA.OKI2018_I69.XSR.g15155.t1.cds [Oikopleura dioica]
MTEFFEYMLSKAKSSFHVDSKKKDDENGMSKRPLFPPPPPPFDLNKNYVGQAHRTLKSKPAGPVTPLTRSVTTNSFGCQQKKDKPITRTFDLISWLRNKKKNPSKKVNVTKSMFDLTSDY